MVPLGLRPRWIEVAGPLPFVPHYIGGSPRVFPKSSNKTPIQKLPYGRNLEGQGLSPSPFVGRPRRWSPPWTPPSHLVGWLGLVESNRDSTFHSDLFRMILETTFHKFTGPFPNLESDFLYMNLILRTIPDLLVMSWIPSETPNKTSNSIPYSIST